MIDEGAFIQFCQLGNLDDVLVNGQHFAFEDALVARVFANREDRFPSGFRAEWGNVMWCDPEINPSYSYRMGVPQCFIDSAPITDQRQPAAVTWADLIERALIEKAEKIGGWY